jgi:hypothetical protein
MHGSTSTRTIATLVLAAATFGCASLIGRPASTETTCYPHKCILNVENYNGRPIAVRYYDSTGVGDVLGEIGPMGSGYFALTRRTARTVTIEVTRDKQLFRAQTTVGPRRYQNVIRFPADFEAVVK